LFLSLPRRDETRRKKRERYSLSRIPHAQWIKIFLDLILLQWFDLEQNFAQHLSSDVCIVKRLNINRWISLKLTETMCH
jgi:hypothetical protein